MAKKTALIIPASIRSHVLPSFYLAELLSDEYDIVYAVGTHILEELCVKNGFKCFTMGGFRIGLGLEERYIQEKYGKVSFVRQVRAYVSNELFFLRRNMYDRIFEDWEPDLVILDVFMSTDFFVLNQYSGLKVAFFNPMPSIYNIEDDTTQGAHKSENKVVVQKNNPFSGLVRWLLHPRRSVITLAQNIQNAGLMKRGNLDGSNRPIQSKFTLLFAGVPELVLLPEEFEFKLGVAKECQMYLGLCQRENRVDTELDNSFYAIWPDIVRKKANGVRIVYCSFGTFFEGADRSLLNFVRCLCEAIKHLGEIHLICSVNKYVIEVLEKENLDKNRISLFSRVPQTAVLEYADAFITHGGMGSIKESIYYEVPMLVFPLDPAYDQNDNALKVEYHKIGIRGVFRYERPESIRTKLLEVLSNDEYRGSLRSFKGNIENRYLNQNIRSQLKNHFNI